MIETCQAVMNWLQALTAASIFGNIFMLGLLAFCIWEMHRR